MADDVHVKFGASIDDLKSKLGEVTGIFGEVTKRFAALAAVMAGGAAFKAFVDEANQANIAAEKMSRTLGITADEAGVLAVAIDDIASKMGVEAGPETYTAAFLKFNRALASSSDELKALGVDVDAVKNGTKSSNEVFLESLQLFNEYKPGIDQTQFAMKAFGKSVQEVQVLSQLNAKALEDARKAASDLNLTITAEGVKAAEDYRVAVDNVGDVLQGVRKTIGEAVMPMLSSLASSFAELGPSIVEGTKAAIETFVAVWKELVAALQAGWSVVQEILSLLRSGWEAFFGSDGPGAMEIFKNALRIVHAAFVAFRIGVEVVVEAVKTGIEIMKSSFSTWAEIARAALHLDFAGAKAAWQAGLAEREAILAASAQRMIAIGQKGGQDLNNALVGGGGGGAKAPAGSSASGGDKKTPGSGDSGGADLALMQAKQQAALALQMEYLRQAGSIYDDAYAKNLISTKQFYDAKLAVELQGVDATIAAKKKEADAAAKSAGGAVKGADKAKFLAEEAKLVGEINVLEAKRTDVVRANASAYAQAEQQRLDEINSIKASAALQGAEAEVSTERQALQQKLSLRQVSVNQALELERALEAKRYEAVQTGLAQRQELVRGDAAKQAALDAEMEAAAREHQSRLTGITQAAEQERLKGSQQINEQAQAGFAQMIGHLVDGTLSVKDAFKGMGQFIAQTMQNLIAQRFTEQLFNAAGVNELINGIVGAVSDGVGAIVKTFIKGEAQKTAAEKVGSAQRTAVRQTDTMTANTLTALKTEAAVTGEIIEGEAAVAGAATKIAADETASGASIAATAASAIANIAAKAWEVAASVYSALAGIPYVGPFIAPVAAIAATAVVLGFVGRIASSEGGEMNVPEDRLNFVHKNETILPAPFAAGLRELVGQGSIGQLKEGMSNILDTLAPQGSTARGEPGAFGADMASPDGPGFAWGLPGEQAEGSDGWSLPADPLPSIQGGATDAKPASEGGPPQGAKREGDVHLHVQAIDGQSVKKLFMDHGPALARSLQNQRRNLKGA